MPEENGNLLPGDPGYVAPETPAETTVSAEETGDKTTLREELQDIEHKLEEAENKPAPPTAPAEDTVSLSKYNQLLAAYTKLKVRVSLDHMYEKQLDAEAGL